ncbi:MAG: DNA repair protein RecN [Bacteroidia bacterium]|nr:DNA repair protein RecN [Bacteroidia bacterium]
MLAELRVNNYALIKNLVFTPENGFNVITGETGAGKSIILGALGLILGERSENFSIAENEEKCIIEGVFEIKNYNLEKWFNENEFDYNNQLIIRREISLHGRSRAFINDTPAQLNQLKDLSKNLIDIHSQHQNLDLFQKSFQFKALDSYCGTTDLQEDYFKKYNNLKNLYKTLESIIETERKIAEAKDYKQFLFEELENAGLKENETEALDEEYNILNSAEENLKSISEIKNMFVDSDFAVLEQISAVKNLLRNISKNDKRFEDLLERTENTFFSLKEIVSDIDKIESQIVIDPQRLELINQRISFLHSLTQKHKETDLIKVKLKLEEELGKFNDINVQKNEIQNQISLLETACKKIAFELSIKRNEAKTELEEKINNMVESLGMKGASVKIDLSENKDAELGNFGINDTNFLLSASKDKMFNPIQNIASGGEISRLMLILKSVIAEKNIMPTIIFDEIDTGISGDTALKIADLMKQLATKTQLIVITHLPQIAASGKSHFFVYKDLQNGITSTGIKKLNKDQRIENIAEMIGGKNYSNSIFEGAKQMID